ncbi:MAG TPA: protein-methionine-sulfoxide reductase catalytic subunit MsrP, partial [Alphaproteobacteria bacterium]|nr:protein-methionine-sulfoxide reductase catalytic subunit MsrP [Alphaproteobacteria bacterium]
MLIRTRRTVASTEITDEDLYLRRREFLREGALALAGAAGATSLLLGCDPARDARAEPVRRATVEKLEDVEPAAPRFRVDEPPTDESDATSYNNFYELGLDKDDPSKNADKLRTEPWSVVIEGEVAKPGTVPLETLLRPHALEERIYRLRCVEAWSMVIPWIGIPLRDVLARFEPTSNARYVAFQTLLDPEHLPGQRRAVLDWPYREGLRIDEAMHPLSLLAVGMYGKTLPAQ